MFHQQARVALFGSARKHAAPRVGAFNESVGDLALTGPASERVRFHSFLFGTKGVHWIHVRGAQRRNQTGDQADYCQQQGSACEGHRDPRLQAEDQDAGSATGDECQPRSDYDAGSGRPDLKPSGRRSQAADMQRDAELCFEGIGHVLPCAGWSWPSVVATILAS
jgi:hypothetical protein